MLRSVIRKLLALKIYAPIFSSVGFSASLLFLAKLPSAQSMDWYSMIALDYLVWLAAAFSAFALFLDYSKFYRQYGYGSTLSFDLVGLSLIVLGRLSSLAYSMLSTGFKTPLIGGCTMGVASIALASPVITGAFIGFIAVVIHSLRGRPVVFLSAPTFQSVHCSLLRASSSAAGFIFRHSLPFVFLVCFLMRLIPELRYPDLPIGYDTVEYIAYLRDYALQFNPFQAYTGRNVPPLMSILLSPFLAVTDPWNIMKVWGPLMCGLSGLLSALVARRIFGTSSRLSFLVGIVGGLNIIALGSTEQWHRHMLGTVLLLCYIASTTARWDRFRLATLLGMAMAYEPTAALSAALSFYHAVKSRRSAARVAYAIVLIASAALLVWYMRQPFVPSQITGISITGVINSGFPNTTIDLMVWWCVFLLPMAPAILVLERVPGGYKFLLLILVLAVIQPALMPYTSLLEQHRWASMLVFAAVPAAVVGYMKVDRRLLAAFSISVLVVGAAYVAVPDSNFYLSPLSSSWKYRYQQGFPWELKPLLTAEEYLNVRNISEALQGADKPVLISSSVYPWVHLDIRSPENPAVFRNLVTFSSDPDFGDVGMYVDRSGVRSVYVVTKVDLENSRKYYLNFSISETIEHAKTEVIVPGSYKLYEVNLVDANGTDAF